MTESPRDTQPSPEPPLWDAFLRLFHWCLAVLFLGNYWLLEAGDAIHEWVGYTILALLAARLVWGLVGPATARFRNFVPTPRRLKNYLRDAPASLREDHRGHNPLGALMVVFLLLTLTVCGISGWLQETDRYWGEDWVEILHETSADIAMAAVLVHIVAVVAMQCLSKRRLIRAMFTGRR